MKRVEQGTNGRQGHLQVKKSRGKLWGRRRGVQSWRERWWKWEELKLVVEEKEVEMERYLNAVKKKKKKKEEEEVEEDLEVEGEEADVMLSVGEKIQEEAEEEEG